MFYSNNCLLNFSNRTSKFIVMYSLYLYFLGLSLRNTSKALEPFKDEKRSYVSIWNWIQRVGSFHIYNKHRRVSAFNIDETIIQIGNRQFELIFSSISLCCNEFVLVLYPVYLMGFPKYLI